MSSCAHVHTAAPDPSEVSAALRSAEQLCTESGERWTPSRRRRTYELLVEAGAPMKAYDLIASYAAKDEPIAKPATVYRALDFLTAHDLVHRIESLNAFLACRADHAGHAATFLICDCCGQVEELRLGLDQAAASAAEARGFTVGRAVLEVHGACANCS